MLKIAVVALGIVGGMSVAYAEEVEVHKEPGAAVVAPGDSKTVVREHEGGAGCASTTVHKENDAGDSKTVKKTDC